MNWKSQDQTSSGFPMNLFGHMLDLFISNLQQDLRQKGFCDDHLKNFIQNGWINVCCLGNQIPQAKCNNNRKSILTAHTSWNSFSSSVISGSLSSAGGDGLRWENSFFTTGFSKVSSSSLASSSLSWKDMEKKKDYNPTKSSQEEMYTVCDQDQGCKDYQYTSKPWYSSLIVV